MSLSPTGLEFVAVDDGFYAFKAVTRTKGVRIATSFSVNPSAKVAVLATGEDQENVYEIEGISYAVGPNVVSHDTRFEDFPYHPANLAVAMDAIRRIVEPGAPVHVIASVPLNRLYLPSGEMNTSVSTRKRIAWSRHVRATKGAALPQIRRVSVIAEAVAAWFDYVISDKFVVHDHLINDFMAVVDPGGRTTNIAVFENGNINLALSGTLDTGMLNVHRRVQNLLAERFPGTKFPRSIVQDAVISGKVVLGASSLDISSEVIAERRALVSDIEIFIQSQFGNQLPLMKRVLFVGGGAQALQLELKERFPRAVFASDPQMANARGMLKFGVAVARFEDEPAVANA